MKILIQTIVLFTLCGSVAFGNSQTSDALRMAEKWQRDSAKPIMGADGRILFTYGLSQPHVVCAPLKLCDIVMESGEVVNDIKASDSARWVIKGAIEGTGETEQEHILIKPKGAGLETSLFIATDRRSYLINLVSDAKDNMGKVGFIYDDDPSNNGGIVSSGSSDYQSPRKPNVESAKEVDVISDRDILGSNLNFNYRLFGSAVKWKPVRVYDDGIKTFIDFDVKKIQSRELPALVIYDTNSLGSLVNYRVQRGRYIVDGLFDRAGLVIGVGRKQAKVNIHRISAQTAVDQPYRNNQ